MEFDPYRRGYRTVSFILVASKQHILYLYLNVLTLQGPDGTRGFSRGRGSFLSPPENPAAPGSVIAGMFAGLHLKGILPGDMQRSLSAEALPFNPGLGFLHQ